VLENMILNFSLHGAKFKTVIKLVANKFGISQSLAREVIAWRTKANTGPSPEFKKCGKITECPAVLLAK